MKRSKKQLGIASDPAVGTCKLVPNPRTGISQYHCFLGKKPGRRGSGWLFVTKEKYEEIQRKKNK